MMPPVFRCGPRSDGILAVYAVFERNRLWPDSSAVIAYDTEDAFHQCSLAVMGGLAV